MDHISNNQMIQDTTDDNAQEVQQILSQPVCLVEGDDELLLELQKLMGSETFLEHSRLPPIVPSSHPRPSAPAMEQDIVVEAELVLDS